MPTLEHTHIENRHQVQPNHANNYETVHGGNLMKWMDQIGALSAMRFAGESCVTAAMDGLEFKRPIPVGHVAVVEAYVYDSGETSVNVRVRAQRENPRTGECSPTTDAHFVFVAVEDGTPTSVPELTVETEAGEALRDEALESAE